MTHGTKYDILLGKGGLHMLTAYGRELRKIRIDHQELLKNMADHLEVSSAYLSAVENGNRNIPEGWTDRIIKLYDLSLAQAERLRSTEEESVPEIRIKFQKASKSQRDVAIAFAKAFDNLSEDQIKRIMTAVKPLGGNKKKR